MFQFEKPEDGSKDRFAERLNIWIEIQTVNFPKVRHYGWWVLHNCVAHPLMGILPINWFFEFHDWTSRKLNAK